MTTQQIEKGKQVMLYYVMNGTEVRAICTRASDAHALAGYDHSSQKYYQVVAKMVDKPLD